MKLMGQYIRGFTWVTSVYPVLSGVSEIEIVAWGSFA